MGEETRYAPGQFTVTDFEETEDGEVVPVFALRGRQEGDVEEVPEAFRAQLRERAAAEDDSFDSDDVVITEADPDTGELSIQFRPEVQERRAREAAATAFDERFEDVDIDETDIVFDGPDAGLDRQTQETILRTQVAADDPDVEPDDVEVTFQDGELMARMPDEPQPVASGWDDWQPGDVGTTETESFAERDDRPDPGLVATGVGTAAQTIGESPIGAVLGDVSSRVFGTGRDDDGLVGEINPRLDRAASRYESVVTNQLEEGYDIAVDANPDGSFRALGLSTETTGEVIVKSAEFANVPAFAQDVLTVGELGARGASFLAREGPEGAQLVQDVTVEGARQTPAAARAAGDFTRKNPRDVGTTAGALVATGVLGGVAFRAGRAGASAGTRGASRVASRLDDVSGVSRAPGRARARAGELRTRTPDVTIRRDPSAGRVEVDPMLRMQVQDLASPSLGGGRVAAGTSRVRSTARGVREDFQIAAARTELATRDLARRAPTSRQDVAQAAGRSRERLSDQIGGAITRAELTARTAEVPDGASAALSRIPTTRRDAFQAAGRTQDRLGSRFGSFRNRTELWLRTPEQSGRGFRGDIRMRSRRPDSVLAGLRADRAGGFDDLFPSFDDVGGGLTGVRESARLEGTAGLARIQAAVPDARPRQRLGWRLQEARTAAELDFRVRRESGSGFLAETRTRSTRPGSPVDRLWTFTPDAGSLTGGSGFGMGGFTDRLSDAGSFVRDGTIRIGPMRPRQSRTTVDADDVELRTGAFPDDADLPGGSPAGRMEFDADIDVGGAGAWGSGQTTAFRRAFSETDTPAPSAPAASQPATRSATSRTGAGVFAGFGAVGGAMSGTSPWSAFEEDTGSGLGFDEDNVISAIDESPTAQTTTPTDLTDLINTGTPTTTWTPTSTTFTPTTTTTTTTTRTPPTLTPVIPQRPARPPWRPPKLPPLPRRDGSPFDGLSGGFDETDRVFDTGVADPSEVLDNLR